MDRGNISAETNPEIIESLEDLLSVCKKLNCQFRIFGSLIPAALKGRFYREIGDIDCFIDNKFKKTIVSELEKRDYTYSYQKDEDVPAFLFFIGFRTENFIKDKKKLSLLFVSFKNEYMEISLRFKLSFRVPYDLINQSYKFWEKEFRGLIPEAALFNVSLTKDKNKRGVDFNALLPTCSLETIRGIKNTDTFFWFNKRLPLVSSLLSSRINRFIGKKQI